MWADTRGWAATVVVAGLAVTAGCSPNESRQNRDLSYQPQAGTPAQESTRNNEPARDVATSDAWITTKVQAQYFADPDVKGRNIDVDTNNGIVTLRGHVDSEAAREKAVAIAQKTDGVQSVHDQLAIGGERNERSAVKDTRRMGRDTVRKARDAAGEAGDTADKATDAVSSAWITTKVQSQYFLDDDVKARTIDVDTTNGVVTLRGTVESPAAHDKAVQIARQTDGVREVVDHLRVAPERAADAAGTADENDEHRADRDAKKGDTGDRMSDAEITMRIQSRYFRDDDINARDIDVSTTNGGVTLRGRMRSPAERQHAVTLARRVPGVTTVNDQLRVMAKEEVESAANRHTDNGRGVGRAIEDGWVTAKIQSKYFVDDLVKSRNIDVDTKNGVVTLTGTVPSARVKERAEMIARETDGVTRVIDRLAIAPDTGAKGEPTH